MAPTCKSMVSANTLSSLAATPACILKSTSAICLNTRNVRKLPHERFCESPHIGRFQHIVDLPTLDISWSYLIDWNDRLISTLWLTTVFLILFSSPCLPSSQAPPYTHRHYSAQASSAASHSQLAHSSRLPASRSS